MHDGEAKAPTHDAAARLRAWRRAERDRLLAARQALSPAAHHERSEAILARLFSLALPPGRLCIGFYHPIFSEVDVQPWIAHRLLQGDSACLPRVVAKDQPLEFRFWTPGAAMTRGVYGIPYPSAAYVARPNVLVVPCLGFDKAGYRLGYGGGFYDRTLAAAEPRPLTVGIGFSDALLETISPQGYDVPLDIILTDGAQLNRAQ